jgi:polyisoprenoid-binding protein YceI
MKKISILAIIFATLTIFGANAQKTAKKVATLDASKSTVTWLGKKVTGEHSGNIGVQSGTLNVNGAGITSGDVVIDMNSMTCTDIKDADYNGKLVGHLKADDFFGTEKFPTATLKITSAKAIKGAKVGTNNTTIGGTITIKGTSQPISFPATVKVDKAGKVSAKGTITIDRTKFDIRYGSKSFFEGLGDKTIYDDFTLDFNVVSK